MKKLIAIAFFAFYFSLFAYLNAQIITTVAGNSQAGYSGDDVAATTAKLNAPCGVAVDKKGNIYIADQNNYRVRKVDTSGIISTFAGIGIQHYSGDGGPATAAELAYPVSVTVDSKGNVYIVDEYNDMIRKVDTNGIIWNFAGVEYAGYYGNGGLATNAQLDNPTGVAVDDSGNVYIADSFNNVIRKVNTSGIISNFAGNAYDNGGAGGGYTGDGGQATDAELGEPKDIVFDINGNLFITDYFNQRVRMVNINGIITTAAGDSVRGYSGDGGDATSAELSHPYGIAVRSDSLYLVDQYAQRIRMVNGNGIISTIAGNGIPGYFGDGGLATAAELNYPTQTAIDASNNIYIADQGNNVIRKITDTNTVTGNKLIAKSEKLRVFPNPGSGVFTFQLSVVGMQHVVSLEVYNVLGEQVYFQSNINNSIFNIDLSPQPSGVYLYRVIEKNGSLLGDGKVVIDK